jgi:3-deoxy-D-manno-octulosonate 8-phosphate phosphatase (KDO 8-P phosphatase)
MIAREVLQKQIMAITQHLKIKMETLSTKLKQVKLLLLDVDGTMTDGGIYIHADGTQTKRFNALDGEGIRRCMEAGIEVGIVSAAGLAKDIIQTRANILGIRLVHAERSSKLTIAQKWTKELGLMATDVAFMGDDIIDAEVMKWCGVSAAPANSHKSAKKVALYHTVARGGEGAVREFVDLILESQGLA